jgi:high mobility group protein 2-like 1
VFGKAQRKDKGKTRFTAYMLWAKDTRKHITIQNPDHDFASMSKRLGEMWANVPETQKYNWRRRAKRLATKMRKDSLKAKAQAGTLPSPYATKYNTSRSSTRRVDPLPAPIIHEPIERSRTRGNAGGGGDRESPAHPKHAMHSPTVKTEMSPKYSPTAISGAAYKMPTANAADVAAHLKLLGDSLTIIGERLKEHEAVAGNLSVSGSLSVLLDSLLCSLGPLICLTTHIPVVGEQLDLKDLFSNTLDNIAYVMPGL